MMAYNEQTSVGIAIKIREKKIRVYDQQGSVCCAALNVTERISEAKNLSHS